MKEKDKRKKMFSAAGLILVLFVIGLLVKRFSVDIVLSGSMEPVLSTGGLIVSDHKRREPEEGDIIIYRLDNVEVTHRVIEISPYGYTTKGDANAQVDSVIVEPEQIIGTVLFCIPYLGYAAAFMKQKAVFFILFIMLVQEFIAVIIHHWKGAYRRDCT